MTDPPAPPSLSDLVAVIRAEAAIPPARPIDGETRLEADLGITGDDGEALLRAVERRFDVSLAIDGSRRPVFGLRPNEYLFHEEGVDPFGLWQRLGNLLRRMKPRSVVTDLTVGRLHEALRRMQRDRSRPRD